MIVEMIWDKDKSYLFTGSTDCSARSWFPTAGDDVRVFEGGERTVIVLLLKGNIRMT